MPGSGCVLADKEGNDVVFYRRLVRDFRRDSEGAQACGRRSKVYKGLKKGKAN